MALINLHNAYLSYGSPLLDHTDLHIEENERVCLVGRNGVGKSTLLNVLAGDIKLDDGIMQCAKGLVVTKLSQQLPINVNISVYDYVAGGLAQLNTLLTAYHHISNQLTKTENTNLLQELAEIQSKLEHLNGWHFDSKIKDILQALALEPDMLLSELSGGWIRRASLARALVTEPNVLLLDEPTNHLDIQTIIWLEKFLLNFKGCIIFVSHDQTFIEHMATRIVDLDRGQLTSYPGSYAKYLELKQQQLAVEQQHNALFDKKLSQEEAWIRQGIKARRTRNEGRVRALKELRTQRKNRLETIGKAKLNISEQIRSGKVIFNLENLSYQIEDKCLIDNFSLTIMRGDRIALIGPNGCGKSTLIKLLLNQLKPSSGTIETGTNLQVVCLDQYREQLNLERSVADNVADGKREVEVNGNKRHVLGYLQDFLFSPERANSPVKALSGGERNRLLLAKLLLKPCNLLILDEPTNDLDIETMELLEETLLKFQGTLILVSHDRHFIDNCATSCLIFEGNGKINQYIGGYTDAYQQQQNTLTVQNSNTKSAKIEVDLNQSAKKIKTTENKKRLTYNEQKELAELPDLLFNLEERIKQLETEISQADFFSKEYTYTKQQTTLLSQLQQQLDDKMLRWEELDAYNN